VDDSPVKDHITTARQASAPGHVAMVPCPDMGDGAPPHSRPGFHFITIGSNEFDDEQFIVMSPL
jgi:hypothetical protein